MGVRSRVFEAGPARSEEAIVLLHGGPGSAGDWRGLLPRFGEIGRAVAFDLPGFGDAEKPADFEYSPCGWGAFVAGALAELGISRAHLVMTDLGGQAGLAWGASHPREFASAVVMGVFSGPRWHLIARAHRAPVVGRLVARGARPGLRPVMRLYARGPRGLPAEVVDSWVDAYGWPTRRALLAFYRSFPGSYADRLAAALRPLDRPALIVWGRHDGFVRVAQAHRHRAAFPSAELAVLDESGHYPHLDDPGGVADLVVPFLRRQLA